ncbi:hypothetical protein DPMN_131090 [Dreissena polymorpha]|uniref:Uncharacterized protein n=1 Tax=Dreissena polymorpha TaxID=45954 RepID=A0A9D4K1R8_DREPO|nr:hypothetical protein DPMN_131090 [Dreissena polymorpha]
MAKECKAIVTCRVCDKGHPTALHVHSDTTTRSHGGGKKAKLFRNVLLCAAKRLVEGHVPK